MEEILAATQPIQEKDKAEILCKHNFGLVFLYPRTSCKISIHCSDISASQTTVLRAIRIYHGNLLCVRQNIAFPSILHISKKLYLTIWSTLTYLNLELL